MWCDGAGDSDVTLVAAGANVPVTADRLFSGLNGFVTFDNTGLDSNYLADTAVTSTLLTVADVTECGAPTRTYFDIDSTEVEFSLTVANSFALTWELVWLFEDDPGASSPDSGTTVVACGGTEVMWDTDLAISTTLFTLALTDDDSGVVTDSY